GDGDACGPRCLNPRSGASVPDAAGASYTPCPRAHATWRPTSGARPLRAPGGHVALDLPRVTLEVVRVDPQPVLGPVRSGLGVAPPLGPGGVSHAPEDGPRAGAHRLDGRQRLLDGQGVIVEVARPALLVVADDHGIRLREQGADAAVRVRLAVGAVDHHLV